MQPSDIRCPVLGLFGALDQHIPLSAVQRIDQGLAEAGVRRQIICYSYADHGFFCDARSTYHPRAAQDAWHRTVEFFREHLGPIQPVPMQTYPGA